MGPLLAQVKIIQSGGSIIGLDPYTGRQLWSRDGYNDQLRLTGRADSHELAVVNPPAGTIELIDGRDGKLIRESRYLVEEMQQRLQDNRLHRWNHWLSTGDWLVDYRSDAEHAEVMLRVWNPREEKVLLETPLPKEARVATCDRQLLAALDPAGRLILVDFEQQQWHEYQVPVDQDLASVQVLRFADHIVVVGNRIANPQRPLLAHGEIPANGYLYAIGAHDKELSWTTPGVLQGMTIPLMQPRNSPYLIACRFESQQEKPLAVTIALVDLRDGRLSQLVERLSVQGARSISMRLRPELQQIALAVGERNLRLQITDQPPPQSRLSGSVARPTPPLLVLAEFNDFQLPHSDCAPSDPFVGRMGPGCWLEPGCWFDSARRWGWARSRSARPRPPRAFAAADDRWVPLDGIVVAGPLLRQSMPVWAD